MRLRRWKLLRDAAPVPLPGLKGTPRVTIRIIMGANMCVCVYIYIERERESERERERDEREREIDR